MASIMVSLVPFALITWVDVKRHRASEAFVAVSALVRLPGGVKNPDIPLINKFCHVVALTIVTFDAAWFKIVTLRVVSFLVHART